jgi:hypothetical protein
MRKINNDDQLDTGYHANFNILYVNAYFYDTRANINANINTNIYYNRTDAGLRGNP